MLCSRTGKDGEKDESDIAKHVMDPMDVKEWARRELKAKLKSSWLTDYHY